MLDMISVIILFKNIKKLSNREIGFLDRKGVALEFSYLSNSHPEEIGERLSSGWGGQISQQKCTCKRSRIMELTNKDKI